MKILFFCVVVVAMASANPLMRELQQRQPHDGRDALCTYLEDHNITSPDIAPSTYLTSSYLCCKHCTDTIGCAAAVYDNYLCRLKGDTKRVRSVGGTVVHLEGATPVPTVEPTGTSAPTATVAPAHTTQPTSPTTNVPTTPTPTFTAQPTTAAPSSAGTMTLVRRLKCSDSSGCSLKSDSSCRTDAYIEGECYNMVNNNAYSHSFKCYSDFMVQSTYSNNNCNGSSTDTEGTLGQCYEDTNQNYRENWCSTFNLTQGLGVTRQSCQEPGSQCSTMFFVTGQCMSNSLGSGNSIMTYCGDGFVYYKTYENSRCTGTYDASQTVLTNYTFQDNNDNYITWSC